MLCPERDLGFESLTLRQNALQICCKAFSVCQRSHFAAQRSGFKHKEKIGKQQAQPPVDGKLFEIERSKLELDPSRNGGKPSVRRVTHCVFFFGVGEDALNCLGAKRVGRLAQRRMPDVLDLFEIVLPDMQNTFLPPICTFLALSSENRIRIARSPAIPCKKRRCLSRLFAMKRQRLLVFKFQLNQRSTRPEPEPFIREVTSATVTRL